MSSPITAARDFSTTPTASMPPQLQRPALYNPKASPGNADSSDGHNFTRVSLGSTGYFVSEFGVTGMASFESLSPSFSEEHWGVHTDPWRFRNHMPDGMGLSFFGATKATFDRVGREALQQQLYMSMVGQALLYTSMMAAFRSTNIHGSLTWDLGEIWPTVSLRPLPLVFLPVSVTVHWLCRAAGAVWSVSLLIPCLFLVANYDHSLACNAG